VLWLYDTRRRGTFAFQPLTRVATMYVCGVTPYDTTHLGHARTFLVFDVLARLLEARGQSLRYAQNITDIDESILQRAARDKVSWRALGRREERAFLQDMKGLDWRKPDAVPHATREIRAMIEMAERLRRGGFAYETPGGLYFDVKKFPRFGQLSRFSTAKMKRILASQDDARLDDPSRRSPIDFALWRRVSDGPTWPSPFGRGRPGWHLECSAMSDRHLGFPIDIHGGGSDLIYPHHESEIAQSEAAHGLRKRFVGHWVHVAPMRLGGGKMSKSDGNMIFVRDVLKKTTPQALRLYLLDVHYRRPFDHDEERLDRARKRAKALAESLGRGRLGPIERDSSTQDVLGALDDDLHAERAIRALEKHARRDLAPDSMASLRTIARKVLGIL
jgi:L-cysteine:1D-myo-inositol 2-amino-2-deoxy-alpha-D-glucopyranoside ligase